MGSGSAEIKNEIPRTLTAAPGRAEDSELAQSLPHYRDSDGDTGSGSLHDPFLFGAFPENRLISHSETVSATVHGTVTDKQNFLIVYIKIV